MKYEQNLVIRLIAGLVFILIYDLFEKFLFYFTVYPSYFIINLLYEASLLGGNLFLGDVIVNFIPACIAGVAYALLFFLIIFTKDLPARKAVNMFLVGILAIWIINLVRIILLIVILKELGSNYFDQVHLLFWHFISGVYVALVWIFLVKKFKVKKIPIVSDVKYLYKRINS